MNYWPRWINAIKKRTAGLSLAEMGAYDRLLDHYYAEEQPLPADLDECCRLAVAITKDERRAVEKVLTKFFTLTPEGYHNERADEEIALALPKIAAAQANGKRGGRPKGSTKKPSGLPDGLPPDTRQQPTSKAPHPHSSEAIASDGADAPASPAPEPPPSPPPPPPPTAPAPPPAIDGRAALWRESLEVLQAGGCKSEDMARSFMGKLVKDYGAEAVREAVTAAIVAQPADAREYLKATCQRLKGERRDPITVPSNAAEQTQRHLAEQAARAGAGPSPEEKERLRRFAARAPKPLAPLSASAEQEPAA